MEAGQGELKDEFTHGEKIAAEDVYYKDADLKRKTVAMKDKIEELQEKAIKYQQRKDAKEREAAKQRAIKSSDEDETPEDYDDQKSSNGTIVPDSSGDDD